MAIAKHPTKRDGMGWVLYCGVDGGTILKNENKKPISFSV
jgi:hypothetical protein